MPTQTTVTCGLPSGFRVVRWASGPVATSVRTDSGIFNGSSSSSSEGDYTCYAVLGTLRESLDAEVATGVHRVARAGPTMLAFILGLAIASVGAGGIVAPSGLVWLAQQVLDAGALAFYVVATVRIAFGALLISVASASRSPRALRALGCLIVVLGIATALTPALAMERARGEIQWWLQQGNGVVRLTAVVILSLGSFVARACKPSVRAD